MALPRGQAQIAQDVHLGILFRWDGQPTDPHDVRQVQIIATDGETVLATLDSIEHEPDSGEYYVTAPAQILTAVGRHLDRWFYTWVDGEGEQSATQDFYVHEETAPAHYGPALQVGVAYLKGFPPLAPNAQDGITQADLDAAMDFADREIEAAFAADYDIAGWPESAPPLVSILWELIASAKAVEFRDLRLGASAGSFARASGRASDSSADTSADSAALRRCARELLDRILHGWPDRLQLRDADGVILHPRRNRSVTAPRAAPPTSDFF